MRRLVVSAGLMVLASGTAVAEPIDDARVIVELTVTRDQFEGAFDGIADLMLGSMQNELSKTGTTISDDAAAVAVKMLTLHMVDDMVEQMKEPLAEAYVYNISPEALAAYRAFLETEEGEEISAAQGAIMQESLKIGEMIGADVATPAVAAMLADMEDGNWPAGTLKSTQAELLEIFQLPPVSEMPPER